MVRSYKIFPLAWVFQHSLASASAKYPVQSWEYLDHGKNFRLQMESNFGQWTITTENRVKSGGTGTVYKARNSQGKQIALKRVDSIKDTTSPNLLMENISYPYFAQVYDAFRWNDNHIDWQVILMELASGPDLEDYLKTNTMTNAAIQSVYLQIVDAVRYAHTHHLYNLHCKPPNIVFNENMTRIKLIDFDTITNKKASHVARAPSQSPSSHVLETLLVTYCIFQSLEYSTSIVNRVPYNTAAADVWHLGETLVNMILNRKPFDIIAFRGVINATNRAEFVKAIFPTIAEPAAELLGKTFAPVDQRITIGQLYNEVKKVHLFKEATGDLAQLPVVAE